MIRKVMTATINYDHPQCGMLRAFSGLFPQVSDFDYFARHVKGGESAKSISDGFVDAATRAKPDWIWLQLQDTNVISSDAIMDVREALPKCVISHWTGDCRPSVSPYLASICQSTHLTLVSSVGQLHMFRNAGARRAEYLQIAVDWEEDLLGIPDWTPPFRVPEVVLCGNHYGDKFPGTRDRMLAIEALMAAGVDVGVVGNGWPHGVKVCGSCHVKQQHHVYKKAKVALAINHFNDIIQYYSDRQLITMGSGTPVVCYGVPGLDNEFRDGVECFFYHTTHELVANVVGLLANATLRKSVGAAGRAAIWRSHTWPSRILSVVPLVEEVQSEL
jgi:hypothetical protein